jgi:hypothetical protein
VFRRLALLVAIVTFAACGHGSAQAGTGIRGVVMLGPTCPVENVNSPCPDRPFHGQVAATSSDGSTVTVATDAEGRFTMDLAAGTYSVTAVTSGGGPPTATPRTVTVRDGSYTHVSLEVDTGIR